MLLYRYPPDRFGGPRAGYIAPLKGKREGQLRIFTNSSLDSPTVHAAAAYLLTMLNLHDLSDSQLAVTESPDLLPSSSATTLTVCLP